MSLWKIAWRSIQQRGLASLLTAISMALGVMLVVCVLSIHGIVAQSFRNNTNLGYNLIVGAKGGSLQLTLNSVFYLSAPIENIPYDYYLEFLDQDQRAAQRELVAAHGHEAEPDNRQGTDERPGQFSQFTDLAIPICLGDYFDRFRVIGTTGDYFEKLTYGADEQQSYAFSEGRLFQPHSEKYGYFEAIVGSTVANELDIQLGQEIHTTHGDPAAAGESAHVHQQGFHVVGVLAPSGTPNDRAVFVNIEGFYLMAGHAKPLDDDGEILDTGVERESVHRDTHKPLPLNQREVTAILVRTVSELVAPGVQNAINEGPVAQAVLPVLEIFRLFAVFVQPIQRVLLILTVLICVVSGVSILVSIYNSMSDRRHEIAVMRALGANRHTVMGVILLEAVFLSLAGGAMGWTLGHGLNALASPRIEAQTGVVIRFWDLAPAVNIGEMLGATASSEWLESFRISSELLLIPALIALAIVVGIVPAISAYRTDVADSLGK
jgi:putative ABC transport system permease protein